MSDVIEKCARAIAKAHTFDPRTMFSAKEQDDYVSQANYWKRYIPLARASLAILSEPENISDEMVRAVDNNFGGEGYEATEQNVDPETFEEYKAGVRKAIAAAIGSLIK